MRRDTGAAGLAKEGGTGGMPEVGIKESGIIYYFQPSGKGHKRKGAETERGRFGKGQKRKEA
jgi:hypothetical protein